MLKLFELFKMKCCHRGKLFQYMRKIKSHVTRAIVFNCLLIANDWSVRHRKEKIIQ